jgi:uncharacterized lipoprotein YmbA
MIRLLVFIFALMLAGCGISAEPDYYTLAPVDGAVVAGPPLLVEIRRPTVPAYLDRLEMVQKSGSEIIPDNAHVWAAPLGKMAEATLALDLSQRMRGSTIFTESDALGAKASYRVDIDVRQFDPDRQGHAIFTAQIIIADSSGALVKTDVLTATADTAAATGSPMVLVLNNFLGQLADRITVDLYDMSADSKD